MAVHDLGQTAIVSFILRHSGDATAEFIVDVWGTTGTERKLQIRYASPGGMQAAQPGVAAPDGSDSLPKKY